MITSDDVLQFWFSQTPQTWWVEDKTFDDEIKKNFWSIYVQAIACELEGWRSTPEGALAEIIVLDQFSRNLFREDARAYSADRLALALAQCAIKSGLDTKLEPEKRAFMYMPFMHSESKKIHEEAVTLFQNLAIESYVDYELKHKAVIDRFGRYPHRNKALGRESTAEELMFIKSSPW